MVNVLAGDIGGTNTRLLYAGMQNNAFITIAEKTYPSNDYESLIDVLNTFLAEFNITDNISAACFAVAGPVFAGTASVTNLPWVVSEAHISQQFKIPAVTLINDFIAVGYGIDELLQTDVLDLQRGYAIGHEGNAAIIGAGTGLGVSHRRWLNGSHHIFSSEAGHSGFAPENKQQLKLLDWLQNKQSHTSIEMLLSGSGLATIYHFMQETSGIPESPSVKNTLLSSDPAEVITSNALAGKDELCKETLDCFVDIYGAAAGNVALNYYPVDQVYIAGGIAPRIQSRLLNHRFIDAFNNKGAMSSNLKKISVKLIVQNKTGLFGTLNYIRKFIL